MTFLLVSHTSDLNGAERSLFDLAFGLQAQGIPFVVMCPQQGPLVDKLQAHHMPIHIHSLPRPQRDWKHLLTFVVSWLPTVWSLAQWLREQGITVVYNNTIDGLYAPISARLVKVPCLWHIREVKPQNLQGRKIFRWLLQKIPSWVVFNSKATQLAYGDPVANWQVIYNGVRLVTPNPTNSSDDLIYVGYAGQMVVHKRPLHFIHAFAKAYQQCSQLRAIMIGDGEKMAEVQSEIATLRLADLVEVRGYVTDTDSFFAQIDMLLLTSEHEPFGRVLIEAMSAKKPVIAAKVDGIPEVVPHQKAGFLVPFGDIDGYANTMIELAKDRKLREKMGEYGHQSVLERFSLTQYQTQLIERLKWLASLSSTTMD